MHGEKQERGRWCEIRLVGRLGPALRLAFPGLQATIEPRHSVLVVPEGSEQLPALLARLRDRHVEVTAIRRWSAGAESPGPVGWNAAGRAAVARPPQAAGRVRVTNDRLGDRGA